MPTDWELLQRYKESQDQAAFAELAQRHVNMVYGAARRMLRGPGKGEEDVVQAVFLLLSQKAARIGRNVTVGGWLFQTTRYCCTNLRKQEARRKAHEREAGMHTQKGAATSEDLSLILDEALEALGSSERDAILSRFLEKKTATQTAAAMGISTAAAEKRVQRGLQRLRGIFARHGFTVPAAGLMALLATESAKAAPAGLATTAATVTGGANAAAIGIAKGAAVMMKMAMIKIVAAVLVAIIALAGGAVVVAEKAAGPGPIAATTPSQVAAPDTPAASPEPDFPPIGIQHEMMARWDVVMNQQGMDRLKKELTIIPTQSKGYQAYTAEAEKMRIAIKEASTANNVLLLPYVVGWASMNRDRNNRFKFADFGLSTHNLQGFIKLGPPGKTQVSVAEGFAPDAVHAEARKDAVSLKIDPVDFQSRVQADGGSDVAGGPRHMQYQGDVPVGTALVFAGQWGQVDTTELWHVSVWQAFACGDDEYGYMSNTSPKEWIEAGAAQARQVADRAMVWKALAKHPLTKVDPKWEKKLDNGAILRLAGASMPSRWRYCWWDAQGQPVAGDAPAGENVMTNETLGPASNAGMPWREGSFPSNPNETAGLANAILVMVETEDPSVAEPQPGQNNQRRSIIQEWVGKDGRVEIGVGAGPWHDGGAIEVGQEVEVKEVSVKLDAAVEGLHKSATFPGNTWIHGLHSEQPDVEIEIAAFDKQGKEIPQQRRVPQLYSGRGQVTYDDMRVELTYIGAVPADIGSYRVQWRQRSWTTFEGFAKKPVVSPDAPTRVAPAATTSPSSPPRNPPPPPSSR